MPQKLEIARQRLTSLGLPMKCAQYDIAKASDRTKPAAGTVIGVLQNQKVYLYVEDQLKDSIDFDPQARATSSTLSIPTQTPAVSTPRASTSSASASSSTGQTSPRPTVQTQSFWAFSTRLNQFSYRTRDNQPVLRSQWPLSLGRHPVVIAETGRTVLYDFDSRQWSNGGNER
ncbi:hypothetical protein DOTSEDRAFT_25545 [Dothistroma septosporum NZE10]|uniref:Uncharacterized protein n=1 Tax=Dothistroma septosporum (strain NZE10 / CBS 128990) TaxID=675120 RepID=M2WNN2_DOTSN|nr:hypothetical protein DOTSEDRAFT_25545 [Dothistroma septosporum NZE10]